VNKIVNKAIMEAKKKEKSNPRVTTPAKFEVRDGSVVLLPPDDLETLVDQNPEQTIVEKKQDVVVVSIEDNKDFSQVTDAEMESLSSGYSKEVRQENLDRMKEAQVILKPRKDKSGSVVSSGTFDDQNFSETTTSVPTTNVDKILEVEVVEEDLEAQPDEEIFESFKRQMEQLQAKQEDYELELDEDYKEDYEDKDSY